MLNVVFGIIIDTFGSLRAEKMEKYHDTINKCFICAIDKQVFDRASDQPNGFERHIRYDHRMWNYLYFIIFLWYSLTHLTTYSLTHSPNHLGNKIKMMMMD